MHPVIQHLFKRKNKVVPVDDDRKIALVLFQGLMTGVRGAGALVALKKLNLENAFDYIFTVSAGFPNASYLLSGNTALGASIYYEDLVGLRFINPLKFWGIANINLLVKVMKEKKPLDFDKIYTSPSKLFVRLWNVEKSAPEYLEIHDYPGSEYFNILKAATFIPFLQPGSVKIGNTFYKDGGFSKLATLEHLQRAIESDATDILVIYNRVEQKVLDFSQDERIFEISPHPNWSLSRFETRQLKLVEAFQQMKVLTLNIFDKML